MLPFNGKLRQTTGKNNFIKIKGSSLLESFQVGSNVNQDQEITGTVLISISTAGGTTYKETLPSY